MVVNGGKWEQTVIKEGENDSFRFSLVAAGFLLVVIRWPGGAASVQRYSLSFRVEEQDDEELSALLISVLFWLELTFQLQTYENAVQVPTAVGLSRWT